MTGQGKSAIAAEHWLPVYEHLVQGMFHACNNRVAALSGISQLYDAQLSSGAEGMQQLAAEVVKLRELMSLCRAGSAARGGRREPADLAEALRAATRLLAYHLEARQLQYAAPAESGDVEPVLLWTGDALRFAVLAFLAASGSGARGATISASVARVGEQTVLTITAPGPEAAVRGRAEYAALAAAAALEQGHLSCASGPAEQVLLTLALPGLNAATARG